MHAQFFVDVIVRKPALLKAMLVFNGVVAPPLVREDVPQWNVPGLKTALLAEELSRFRVASPGVPGASVAGGAGFWDFTEESRRLAFLEPREREHLSLVFGVSVHAAEITRIISRDQVLAIREGLGEALYQYAVQRGQYQLGTVRQVFLVRDIRAPLMERVREHGQLALALCASAWPEALRQRVSDIGTVAEAVSPTVQQMVWFGVKKLLLKEVAPQWTPCFD